MKLSEIQTFVGKVASLDLANGQMLTTKIESVDADTVVCKKPLVFQVSINPMRPNEVRIGHLPYGAPLCKPREQVSISLTHIIQAFEPLDEVEDAYMQETSGVAVAKKPGLLLPG